MEAQHSPLLVGLNDRRITDQKPNPTPLAEMVREMEDVETLVDRVAQYTPEKLAMMAKMYESMNHPLAEYLNALARGRAEAVRAEAVKAEEVKKVSHTRKNKGVRCRYNIPGYSSLYELAITLELQVKTVRETLIEAGLIKHISYCGVNRSMLTSKGREYGGMWNPRTKQFMTTGFNDELTKNAQPVFKDDVLTFF